MMPSGLPLRSIGVVHQRVVHSRRVKTLAAHLARLLPLNASVLDVGCGDGLIAALILERRQDVTLLGVDVLIRPRTHIPVTMFDGKHLPFPDQSWDAVMFCDVLHHATNPVALLEEGVRVARQSILIKDHFADGFLARTTLRFMDFVGNAPQGVVLPYNYLSSTEWREALQICGLQQRELIKRLHLYPWWANVVFGRSLHFVGAYEVLR